MQTKLIYTRNAKIP